MTPHEIVKEYYKQAIIWKLQKDLIDAGFALKNISYNDVDYDPPLITIYLDIAETKDPTSIVEAHVYKDTTDIDWKAEYAEESTTDGKLKVIAKKVGTMDLTDNEIIDGRIY